MAVRIIMGLLSSGSRYVDAAHASSQDSDDENKLEIPMTPFLTAPNPAKQIKARQHHSLGYPT